MAQRDVRITLRERLTTGGSVPGDALFGEPFINLFDGILKFSGVTGGSFEQSTQNGVFEVGANLYNQKIINRLNINDGFIISGGTGIISTYNGQTGGSLVGKFLSGTTSGFTLANVTDIMSASAGISGDVQFNNGSNGFGAENVFNYNSTIDTLRVPNFSATTISAGTNLYSAGTSLETIIYNIANSTENITSVQPGSNITTGGTASSPTISVVASPSFDNVSFSGTAFGGNIQANNSIFSSLSSTTVSGATLYSGSTDLNIFFTQDRAQINTKANLSGATFTGAISAPNITDTALTAGWAVYADTGGLLQTNSGFTFDQSSSTLGAQNFQLGSSAFSGTMTIWGDVLIMGQSISAFTSQLYIEDNNIIINFNPSASTTSTSLGSGFNIQDGSGVSGTDVFWDIRGTATTVDNRSFSTNLNDLRIRETGSISAPNGARVLAEFDILDGGSY